MEDIQPLIYKQCSFFIILEIFLEASLFAILPSAIAMTELCDKISISCDSVYNYTIFFVI